MACKFRAELMTTANRTHSGRLFQGAMMLAACLALGSAWAEKADRSKPIVLEADKTGTVDYQRQVVVFTGSVSITQGTMVLRAERVEMRELPGGYRAASATGGVGKPATWRQRLDKPDESMEGSAERIEFDGQADTLRFLGSGTIRRMRAGLVVDEITGGAILWDNRAELFKVEGGAVTPVNPGGRVRVILSPRAEAASEPGATAPAAPVAPGLAPSRDLGGRR